MLQWYVKGRAAYTGNYIIFKFQILNLDVISSQIALDSWHVIWKQFEIQQGKFSLQQKWTAVVTAAHVVNMHSDVFPRCSILCGHACILYCMCCYILYQMGKYQVMSQFTYRLLDNVIVINNIFSEWIHFFFQLKIKLEKMNSQAIKSIIIFFRG